MTNSLWQNWEKDIIKAYSKHNANEIQEILNCEFPDETKEQQLEHLTQTIKKFEDAVQENKNIPIKNVTEKTTDIVEEKSSKKEDKQTKLFEDEEEKANVTPNQPSKVSFNGKTGETTFEGVISIINGEPITPEIVMKAHNLKPDQWQVVSFTSNAWQAQAKNSEKLALWQSKITVKPVKQPALTTEYIENFYKKLVEKYQPKYLPAVTSERGDHMLEINISDLHFAKLAWEGDSGENYDYKIAKKRFNQIIDAECARLEKEPAEKILFAWTNDFFNCDTINNTTTQGTPQSTDLRWAKMFDEGTEILRNAIDRLQQYAPVKTFYIASNHCQETEYHAIKFLEAWFRNNPRVEIDCSALPRHYETYGKNLIGFSHSSFEKPKNLPIIMAAEAPQAWGKAKNREMHLAHIHSEKVMEEGGVVMRWLPSVTGPDNWHKLCGYVGARTCSYSFNWDKEDGLQAINVVNVKKSKPKTVELEK